MVRCFGTEISGNRRPKAELSTTQRSAIIIALEGGGSPTALAAQFGCARSTIYDTQKRFQQHQSIESLPRSGRPSLISDRAKREVYQLARRYPQWSYITLASQLRQPLSKSTIRSILIGYGLRKRRARKRIPLSTIGARKRYRFGLKYRGFRAWDTWIFSDECSV
jgi:transposase